MLIRALMLRRYYDDTAIVAAAICHIYYAEDAYFSLLCYHYAARRRAAARPIRHADIFSLYFWEFHYAITRYCLLPPSAPAVASIRRHRLIYFLLLLSPPLTCHDDITLRFDTIFITLILRPHCQAFAASPCRRFVIYYVIDSALDDSAARCYATYADDTQQSAAGVHDAGEDTLLLLAG